MESRILEVKGYVFLFCQKWNTEVQNLKNFPKGSFGIKPKLFAQFYQTLSDLAPVTPLLSPPRHSPSQAGLCSRHTGHLKPGASGESFLLAINSRNPRCPHTLSPSHSSCPDTPSLLSLLSADFLPTKKNGSSKK